MPFNSDMDTSLFGFKKKVSSFKKSSWVEKILTQNKIKITVKMIFFIWAVGNFMLGSLGAEPVGQGGDVSLGDRVVVFVA